MIFEEEKELMEKNIECLETRIKNHNRRCDNVCSDRRQANDCGSLFHTCPYCPKNLKIAEDWS